MSTSSVTTSSMSSVSSVRGHTIRYAAAAVALGSLVAGCGGGGGSKGGAVGSAAKVVAAVKSGAAAIGAVSGMLDVSQQCATISDADVQALIKSTPGSPLHNPLECAWSGTTMHVDLSPQDADKHSYNQLVSPQDHAIAGLGDLAEWSEPVEGMTVPNVNAHKGSLTCYVQGADDITTTTLPYTGSDPFYKITDADALAYATKLAKLCADVFSVS